jgi:hypothetical protein
MRSRNENRKPLRTIDTGGIFAVPFNGRTKLTAPANEKLRMKHWFSKIHELDHAPVVVARSVAKSALRQLAYLEEWA